eukprot:m.293198 g.293198  ORF g.293198 m.293198 type:complete len:66 (+) comp16241_c0_seq1:3801-3998(+)
MIRRKVPCAVSGRLVNIEGTSGGGSSHVSLVLSDDKSTRLFFASRASNGSPIVARSLQSLSLPSI